MDDFIIIGWPEIQAYMELEGFEENTTLITPNPYLGIDSSTYLVDKNKLLGFLFSENSYIETGNDNEDDDFPSEDYETENCIVYVKGN